MPGPAGEPLPVGAVRLFFVVAARRSGDSAEALYRIVADIADPVGMARAALSAVDLIQGSLLPDLVSIRRAAIRQARQRDAGPRAVRPAGDFPVTGVRRAGQRGQRDRS